MPSAMVNNISINYEISGHGAPLLLIAGFGSNLNAWAFQVRPFSKHFQVVRFDNRGIGKSDRPKGPYSTREMAEDATGLLDHLGIERAHVVGHSMGGAIGQEIAINHPERVAKLVLCATFAGRDGDSGVTEEYARTPTPKGRSELVRMAQFAFNRPLVRNAILFVSRIVPPTISSVGIDGQRAAVSTHHATNRLQLIRAPTLVVVGTGDRLIKPTSSELIAASIPNAQLVKIEGASHVLNIERRREFNKAVLSFLTSK